FVRFDLPPNRAHYQETINGRQRNAAAFADRGVRMRQVGNYCGNSEFGAFGRRRLSFSDPLSLAVTNRSPFGGCADIRQRGTAESIFGKCVIARPASMFSCGRARASQDDAAPKGWLWSAGEQADLLFRE